jgi:hypothetical protein
LIHFSLFCYFQLLLIEGLHSFSFFLAPLNSFKCFTFKLTDLFC